MPKWFHFHPFTHSLHERGWDKREHSWRGELLFLLLLVPPHSCMGFIHICGFRFYEFYAFKVGECQVQLWLLVSWMKLPRCNLQMVWNEGLGAQSSKGKQKLCKKMQQTVVGVKTAPGLRLKKKKNCSWKKWYWNQCILVNLNYLLHIRGALIRNKP